jgi:trans-2,3-dihydro-3-hydroxyanthranilate isomerase
VRLRTGAAAFGEFDAPKVLAGPEVLSQPEEIAAAVGLNPAELTFENHRPTVLKGAPTFGFVPIANLEAMSKIRVSPVHWARTFTDRGIEGVYFYTRQSVRTQSAFHVRMLAPDLGVPEDPATGSAAVGFAHVIRTFDSLPDGVHKRMIEQGLEIGRPSAIALTMTIHRGKLEAVRIGGHAVRVAEGTLSY